MVDDVQRFTGTPAKIAARLCNFATGRAELLPTHIAFLDNEVAPVIRGMVGPWVDMFGFASRVGDAASNTALSDRRINAVKQHIARYASQVNFQIQQGLGETESGPYEDDNSGYYRAVSVFVYAYKPPVTVPKEKPPVVTAATRFEIRLLQGFSVAFFAQADNYRFQIVDIVRRQTAIFEYTGAGLSIGIPKIPSPVSLTTPGPASPFHTTRPAELYMFNSEASLYQDPSVTVGPDGVGGTFRLTIKRIRDHDGYIFTRPRTIPIKGGQGAQMPTLGSATEGVLAKVGPDRRFMGY